MLQDISIILYMGMYVCMFAAGDQAPPLAARRRSVRSGSPGCRSIACVGILAALSAIVLGLTPPAGFSALAAGPYAAIIAVGVIVLAIPAQLLYRFRRPEWATTDEAELDRQLEE